MRRFLCVGLVAALGVMMTVGVAQADNVTVNAEKWAIIGAYGNNFEIRDWGWAPTYLLAFETSQWTSYTRLYHSLLQFDVSTVDPTFESATLRLYCNTLGDADDNTTVHKILPSVFGESEWAQPGPSYNSPQEGVTWGSRDYPNSVFWNSITNPWHDVGGDYGPAIDGVVDNEIGWFEWDVTSLITDWIENGENYGLLLKGEYNHNYREFRSPSNADNQPQLVLWYGGPEFMPGDANGDNKIDGADLAIWQQNYDPLGLAGDNNTFEAGDWNDDGVIDGADLALWQQNYAPLGYQGLGADVPEPTTMLLIGSGVLAAAGYTRRRRMR